MPSHPLSKLSHDFSFITTFTTSCPREVSLVLSCRIAYTVRHYQRVQVLVKIVQPKDDEKVIFDQY